MKRAVDVFEFEQDSARSPMVERVWQTRSVPEESFISVAASNWEMVITRQDGEAWLTVLGVDRGVTLPAATKRSVRLDGYRLELPGRDDVDAFVAKLVRTGLLEHDPVPQAAVHGPADGLSARSLERRVSRATGLTRGGIRQIRRAELAVRMLTEGVAPIDVALRAGYADQPHLTRSLRRFVGQTPAEIAASASDR